MLNEIKKNWKVPEKNWKNIGPWRNRTGGHEGCKGTRWPTELDDLSVSTMKQ